MFRFCLSLVACLVVFASLAQASPVEYRFSGTLSGYMSGTLSGHIQQGAILLPASLVSVPFQVSILGDTNNVFPTGYIAGAGPGFANNCLSATWEIDGFGTAVSNYTQIYSLPGLAQVGFGWNGQVFPLDTVRRAQPNIFFSGNAIALDPNYSGLSTGVEAAPVTLGTSLKNPSNELPEYTTLINVKNDNGSGTLTLEDITNVSYSVVPIPEAATTLKLYDNFKKAAIDPAKWDGYESSDQKGLAREAVREIHGGVLRMADHAYGLITSGSNVAKTSGLRLRMIDGASVTTMRGTITVTTAVIKTPPSGPEAVVRARIGGYFFNVGTPTPGDSTGDIIAEVGLVRSTNYTQPNTVGIYGYVYQCLDSDCGTASDIETPPWLGDIKIGQAANVSIQWDQANHQFIFQYYQPGKKMPQSQYVPYQVSDTSPPATNNKRLRVDAQAPPCVAAPCTEANIEALFGPVYINP